LHTDPDLGGFEHINLALVIIATIVAFFPILRARPWD